MDDLSATPWHAAQQRRNAALATTEHTQAASHRGADDFYGVVAKVACQNGKLQKSVKTAVPDAGNPPGALVLTKLVE